MRPSPLRATVLPLLLSALLGPAGCASLTPADRHQRYQLAELYQAADAGNPTAQLRLGQAYGQGAYGLTRDYARSLHWLRASARNGNGEAAEAFREWTNGNHAKDLVVAAMAAHVRGRYDRSIPLLRALSAAGVPEARYALGKAYLEGKGVPADTGRAVTWLRRAADQGNDNARYLLGAIHAERSEYRDFARAAALWQRCAADNHPLCQYSLGLLRLSGRGVEADEARGRELIRHAAGQGNAAARTWLARWNRLCRRHPATSGCADDRQ